MTKDYFQYIPRRNRAKGLVPAIRRSSKRFKTAVAEGDDKKQKAASKAAWTAMTQLFEILRGEQDTGNLADAPMNVDTGFLAKSISSAERATMLSLKKIERTRSTALGLRDALNKIAHYEQVDFRVDGRNAHYLLLAGTYHGKHWVAEILVSKLCKNAAAAIQAITG